MEDQNVHPQLLEVAEQFESERLLIRAPRWGDGAMLNEAVAESMPELSAWMPWAVELPSVAQSEITVREGRARYLDRSDLWLLLIEKATGRLVGSSGLHRIEWEARKFEIGYWARSGFTGQGYITEAVHRITSFAAHELGANRIEIRCDARNVRSAAVAERCGFTREGLLRMEKLGVDGSLRDTLVFAKVRGIEF
ncbi:GNAT family N-acetyltransferase [Paenibacillus xanthanilyticus]|uniref:GNAT family N-acetyltransferase n=1 Tax=Paenibacillus xanthanilyticus TaxID=1783531 RepID=A0ABV8JTF3_9BACL